MQVRQVFSNHDEQPGGYLGHFTYCPVCGTHLSLKEKGGRPRPTCSNCGFVQFKNPVPGVVVVIEQDAQVLLGKRAGGFGEGKWGLPQGYIEFDEDFLTAAIREVKEETGLDIEIRSILNVVSNRLSPQLHTLAIILLASVINGEPHAADDMAALRWFPLAGPLPDMAFEADRWIIENYRKPELKGGLPADSAFASRYTTGER